MNDISFLSFNEAKSFLSPLSELLTLVDNSNYLSGTSYFNNGILPTKYEGVNKYYPLYAIHEFSHCIEFSMSKQIRRLKYGSLNFVYKTKVKVMGQYYNEPTTCQGFEREIRTLAIQFFIINYYKKELNLSTYKVISLLKESISAICTFLQDAFIFKYDINKMALQTTDKDIFIKQVFKRVLLEMSVLSIDLIILHKKKVKQYIKKKQEKIPCVHQIII